MWSQVGREVHPVFCCPQKLSERARRSALGDRELDLAHQAFGRAVLSRRPCSAHRPLTAFAPESVARLLSSLLTALPDRSANSCQALRRRPAHGGRPPGQHACAHPRRGPGGVVCVCSGPSPHGLWFDQPTALHRDQPRRALSLPESSRLAASVAPCCSPGLDRPSASSCDEPRWRLSC